MLKPNQKKEIMIAYSDSPDAQQNYKNPTDSLTIISESEFERDKVKTIQNLTILG